MRYLSPEAPAVVDVESVYADDARPPRGDLPWVLLNMVASVDGAAFDATGRSGGLAGPADRRMFVAIRAVADVVMAGAQTVRVEGYGPVRLPERLRAARVARGQAPLPRLAVASGSLHLAEDLRVFAEAREDTRPIVVTTSSADPAAHSRLAAHADVVAAGARTIDWGAALRQLRRAAGADVVLVEGGPTVTGQLLGEGVVDEICLTLSPTLVGGDAPRIGGRGAAPVTAQLRLDRVLEEDGFLFLRYVRPQAS